MEMSILKELERNIGKELMEIESKGVKKVNIYTLAIIAGYLRRRFNIDFFKLLSKEDRKILEKRGCIIFAPFDDGIERIYTAEDIKYAYEQFHYNRKVLTESMTLDGATSMDIDNEFCKLDKFLRTDVLSCLDDPKVEFTEEQYQRAKTYLEVERFIDSFKQDISLNPSERINIIYNIVDYTLAISSDEDKKSFDTENKKQDVSAKILSFINDSLWKQNDIKYLVK